MVREGVEAKLCRQDGNPQEVFLICRSGQRRVKEQAMHVRFSGRIEAQLGALQHRLAHSHQAIERSEVDRQVGRILERNRHRRQALPDRD